MTANKIKTQPLTGLLAGSIPGGQYLPGEYGVAAQIGATYESTRARFSQLFDRLVGGVRAAASLPYLKFTSAKVMPTLYDKPAVIDVKLNALEIVMNSLIDEKSREATGLPPDPQIARQLDSLSKQLDDLAKTPIPRSIIPGKIEVIQEPGR